MSESQSRGEAKGSIEILQNNFNFFPKEQSLKDLLSSPRRKTSACQIYVNLTKRFKVRGKVHCYPMTSQILQRYLLRNVWRETVCHVASK